MGGDVLPPVCSVQAKEYCCALLPVKNFLLGDIIIFISYCGHFIPLGGGGEVTRRPIHPPPPDQPLLLQQSIPSYQLVLS